jgi:hypothetical protein
LRQSDTHPRMPVHLSPGAPIVAKSVDWYYFRGG